MQCTKSFTDLLLNFRCVFTQPSFLTFVELMIGWALSRQRRFVTALIVACACVHKGHYCRYQRFFSNAVWCPDCLCLNLTKMLVDELVPTGDILLAVDDTLCRKRGLTVFGTGMHHDPLISSKAKPLTSWGHDWVVLTLIVQNLSWAPTKVWSLPIAWRLYRNRQGVTKGKKKNQGKKKGQPQSKSESKKSKPKKPKHDPNHRTRPELAVELISMVSGWFPDRKIIVTGDTAYGGESVLRKLPDNVELISHVFPTGVLYEPLPKSVDGKPVDGEKKDPRSPRKRGPKGPRKKGKRLPDMAAWADDESQPWKKIKFDQFGLHTTLLVKTIKALYYKAGKDRVLTIVLTRDAEGKRPDQRFYCTDLDWSPEQILSTYAARWSIEVTFENCKQHLGLEDPANRTEQAVRRTAPMALFQYSLIVLWFHKTGHRHFRLLDRPWYRHKSEPSFADMLVTLRRMSWEEKLNVVCMQSRVAKKTLTPIIEFLSLTG